MDKFVKAGVTPLAIAGAEYPAQQSSTSWR